MEPPPGGVEDIVQVILSPATEQNERKRAEAQLRELQRSPQGWTLAKGFLSSPYKEVRFYGPLTYTIKLNSDGQSLSPAEAGLLLEQLMMHFVSMVFSNESSFVVLKMCSTLATFFMRYPEIWSKVVKHCICSLALEQMVSFADLEQAAGTDEFVQRLSLPKLLYAVKLITALAYEASKSDPDNVLQQAIHMILRSNLEDVMTVLSYIFDWHSSNTKNEPQLDDVTNEAIKCLLSWIGYCQRSFSHTDSIFSSFGPVLGRIISWATSASVGESSVELLVEVLENFPELLSQAQQELILAQLKSAWGMSHVEALLDGDAGDVTVTYSKLLFAYANAEQGSKTKSLLARSAPAVLDIMHRLGNCSFYGADDCIWAPLLEFYSTYVENFVDIDNGSDESKAAIGNAKAETQLFLGQLWPAIQPRSETKIEWTSMDKESFAEFRRQARDFVETANPFLGAQVLESLVSLAITGFQEQKQQAVEASFFFLGALGDQISEDSSTDEILGHLFESDLLDGIGSEEFASDSFTISSVANTLGLMVPFFERREDSLRKVLAFLFKTITSSKARTISARSIFKICSNCRQQLRGNANELVQFYRQAFVDSSFVDSYVRERVLEAVCCVIEAVGQVPDQVTGVQLLLASLQEEVNGVGAAVAQSSEIDHTIDLRDTLLSILRCMLAMAKGLETNEDFIDLENDATAFSIWDTAEATLVRSDLFELLKHLMQCFPADAEVFQATCDIIKSGLRETISGPFVFDKTELVRYLAEFGGLNPQPELAVLTMSYIPLPPTKSHDGPSRIAPAMLSYLGQKIPSNTTDPAENPELGQAVLESYIKLMAYSLELLLLEQPEVTGRILQFSLKCLAFAQPFPRRDAAAFWSRFLAIHDQPENIQSLVDNIMAEYGLHVAKILIFQISGECARSDLDILTDPLRKMVFRQRQARAWLDEALRDPQFPSTKVADSDKRVFLQKVMNARGGKQTSKIAKEFWMQCRGSLYSYAS